MRYCNSSRLTWILSQQNKLEVGRRGGGVGWGGVEVGWGGVGGLVFESVQHKLLIMICQGTWSFSRWWQGYIWQRFSLNGHCSWRLYDLCVSAGCTVPHSYRAAGQTCCQRNDSLLAVDSTYDCRKHRSSAGKSTSACKCRRCQNPDYVLINSRLDHREVAKRDY